MEIDAELERKARRLKNVALFAHLPQAALADLAQLLEEKEFGKDEIVFCKADAANSLYLIRSGWVKIFTEDANGQEMVISHVGPGQTIGEMSLLDGQPYLVSVVALLPVRAMLIQREAFYAWLKQNPQVGLDLMRGLVKKMRLNTNMVKKAIDWSNKIAQGNYNLPLAEVNNEHTLMATRAGPDEVEVAEFLAAFHTMIQEVKTREDSLIQQIQELSIHIDMAKVDQEVEEIASSTFFKNLKEARSRLRGQKE